MRLANPLAVLTATLGASVLGLAASACNFEQAGIDPGPATMNFPIAVELYQPDPSVAASHLLVVNSNFDLRFNTGSIQAIDLSRVDAACSGVEDCTLDNLTFIDDNREGLDAVLLDEVGIGSHADGLTLNPGQTKLYLPVRSGRDLTTIGFSPTDGFECDQGYRDPTVTQGARWEATDIRRCSDAYRVTRREDIASERSLQLVGDPVAVAVVPSEEVGAPGVGEFILMVMRGGEVALFLDDGSGQPVPELIHIADGFPENLVTLTMQPNTGIGWLTAIGTDDIARVGIVVDTASPTRSFLYNAGALRLGGIDDGEDTRDFQFHPRREDTAFVLSRRPESVVEVDLDRRGLTSVDLGLRDVYEVGAGPSRLLPIVLGDRTYVLVSCFDAQRLFIIDVDHGALVSVIGGFSGPFELVVDEVTQRLYMVDFTVSVIRVLDLLPLTRGEVPTVFATIGDSTPIISLTGI